MLTHLGDVGTVEVLDALLASRPGSDDLIEAHVVFGNTDWDVQPMARYAVDMGIHNDHPVGRIALPDGELAILHGDDERAVRRLITENVRYVCHGHTHQTIDRREGQSRIINPGALFRARVYTVAVLDTDNDDLQFYPVDEGC